MAKLNEETLQRGTKLTVRTKHFIIGKITFFLLQREEPQQETDVGTTIARAGDVLCLKALGKDKCATRQCVCFFFTSHAYTQSTHTYKTRDKQVGSTVHTLTHFGLLDTKCSFNSATT